MKSRGAMRPNNKGDVREHTNRLFIRSHVLKFKDYVDLKMLLVVCKVQKYCRLLPENQQI